MNARPPLESLLSSRSFRAPECPSLFAKLTMQELLGAISSLANLSLLPVVSPLYSVVLERAQKAESPLLLRQLAYGQLSYRVVN